MIYGTGRNTEQTDPHTHITGPSAGYLVEAKKHFFSLEEYFFYSYMAKIR